MVKAIQQVYLVEEIVKVTKKSLRPQASELTTHLMHLLHLETTMAEVEHSINQSKKKKR